jgi:3-isopropylmalate/(R)-2-methylmalate dehydratase large subunit
MTQKILAAHAGLKRVTAGQFIEAKLDIVLGNDITGPPAIKEFEKMGASNVFDANKVVLVPDHFTPNKDIKAAEQCKILREFAASQGIVNYFEVGEMGIEHALLPEKGLVVAGDAIIGADSHTCTYGALGTFSTGVGSTDMAAGMATGRTWFKVPGAVRVVFMGALARPLCGKDVALHLIGVLGVDGARYLSLECGGPGVASLSMDDRFTVANMAVECGAKNALFPVDDTTKAYLTGRVTRPWTAYIPDADALYEQTIVVDLRALKPLVACPHLPSRVRPVSELSHVSVSQVVIGSCTNGRLEDMRAAAEILRGRRVRDGVRCLVIPASQEIYLQSLREGLLEVFVEAGAAVSTPTCGPCLGGHMGILDEGEVCVATTNRNFVGRMGHVKSEVYLAGPAVAAASAVAGYIAAP